LFDGPPNDCFGCKTVLIQSNIGCLSLALTKEKGAKPVRTLSLLMILSTEARIATDLLPATTDVASVTKRRHDALFLQKLTTTIAIDGGIVYANEGWGEGLSPSTRR
jgi:hypothetical protein